MIYGQEYLLRVQITTASYLNMVADNIYEYETPLLVYLCRIFMSEGQNICVHVFIQYRVKEQVVICARVKQ